MCWLSNLFKKKEEKPSAYISIDEAIEILNMARDSHIWYAEHPELCNDWTGDVTLQREWVEQYTWVISLLIALKATGAEERLDILIKEDK